MKKSRFVYGVILGASLAISPMVADSAGAAEAQMYAITHHSNWVCRATSVSHWATMIDQWYDEISSHAGWVADRRKVNGSDFDRLLFCDPDARWRCEDHVYADEGDAAMLGFHGSDHGNYWWGKMRRMAQLSCYLKGRPSLVRMGDYDLEFLHLSSCHSLDDDNAPYAWQIMYDEDDTPGSGNSLHQLDGFHGTMWIGPSLDDEYRDFADDAFTGPIAFSWMRNMYVTGIDGAYTQCPVAYAISGTDLADCRARRDRERYNAIEPDPGMFETYCYYYIAGCDPSGEGVFTP